MVRLQLEVSQLDFRFNVLSQQLFPDQAPSFQGLYIEHEALINGRRDQERTRRITYDVTILSTENRDNFSLSTKLSLSGTYEGIVTFRT